MKLKTRTDGNSCVIVWVIVSFFASQCGGNDDAKRLYHDLLRKSYNKLIRPVTRISDKLVVKMGIRLSQLIDVVSRSFL